MHSDKEPDYISIDELRDHFKEEKKEIVLKHIKYREEFEAFKSVFDIYVTLYKDLDDGYHWQKPKNPSLVQQKVNKKYKIALDKLDNLITYIDQNLIYDNHHLKDARKKIELERDIIGEMSTTEGQERKARKSVCLKVLMDTGIKKTTALKIISEIDRILNNYITQKELLLNKK